MVVVGATAAGIASVVAVTETEGIVLVGAFVSTSIVVGNVGCGGIAVGNVGGCGGIVVGNLGCGDELGRLPAAAPLAQ